MTKTISDTPTICNFGVLNPILITIFRQFMNLATFQQFLAILVKNYETLGAKKTNTICDVSTISNFWVLNPILITIFQINDEFSHFYPSPPPPSQESFLPSPPLLSICLCKTYIISRGYTQWNDLILHPFTLKQ